MKLIMALMLSNTMLFSASKHPLTMGFLLIMQTIMIAILINMMIMSSWFSLIIMIVLLGGMLVLFIYMASIASNEKFHSNMKIAVMSVMITSFLVMSMMLLNPELSVNINEKIISFNLMSLNKMFNTKNSCLTIMMMTYLMYTMIAINNIVKTNEGPLRMKN